MPTRENRRAHVHSVLSGLEQRLADLQACQPRRREDFDPAVPKVPAIYLLSEHGRPRYVGRTDNLRDRIGGHMLPGSDRHSATLAFQIALADAERRGIHTDRLRADLTADPEFDSVFRAAKERVSQMHIQFIELPDSKESIDQALLQIYIAESLETPYNSFENT